MSRWGSAGSSGSSSTAGSETAGPECFSIGDGSEDEVTLVEMEPVFKTPSRKVSDSRRMEEGSAGWEDVTD
jgi:hypothetical protein